MAARWVVRIEDVYESLRRRRARDRPPAHFRIVSYGGYGGDRGVVVRARVVDDPPLTVATSGEGALAAVRRSVRSFLTDELPGVPLRVSLGGAEVDVRSDDDGYAVARLPPGRLTSPVTTGTISLAADYRGLTAASTPVEVRVAARDARFGVLSDLDDTVLDTGVQRAGQMLRRTLAGSALTRHTFPGTAELYRDLAGAANPVFYVSSSPWNLHEFLAGFLAHRGFPAGPLLLRDLTGGTATARRKHSRIREVLDLHEHLSFVLLGDSGEQDPAVYAEIVADYPGRVLAVYIREVRIDPGDGRVERVLATWPADVPFLLAADSAAIRAHATDLGLLPAG